MSIIKILSYPDPKLKRVAIKVSQVDTRIKQIISDMFETHYAAKNCAALAATQLDIDNPPYITVIDFSEQKNQPLCLINAEIIEKTGSHKENEGCMSVFPDHIHAPVVRANSIKLNYFNQSFELQTMVADGFMAKCIQHELDHLNGTIYLDHLSKVKRLMLENKLQKAIKQKL